MKPQASCPGIEEARSLARNGNLDKALARLERDDAAPPCRGRRLGGRARLLLAQDRPADAIQLFRESIEWHRAAGSPSDQVQDGTALAYVLTFKEPAFLLARQVLENLAGPATSYGEGLLLLPYFQGQLAQETGDLREALRLFARADTWAVRLQAQHLRLAITQARADLLQVLGRDAEADELLEDLLADSQLELTPCDRADILVNAGWLRLLHREAGGSSDPLPVLKEALGIFRGDCRQKADEANVLVNLSLAAIQDGRLDEAETRMQEARAAQPEPDALVASWLHDLAGRIAMARDEYASALKAYDAMFKEAPRISQARWRACLGRALSLEGLGSTDRALDAFEMAERLLDEQIRLIPVGSGRGTFLRDRERGASHLVDLLLKKKEARKAMIAARRSRARVLWTMTGAERVAQLAGEARTEWEHHIAIFRGLRERLENVETKIREAATDELARWDAERSRLETALRRSLDSAYQAVDWRPREDKDLPAPAEGTLLLVFHPLPQGWVAFAVTHTDVAVERLATLPPIENRAGLSRALLDPFATQIDAAERIHILAYGRLDRVDFHALPWKKDVLLSHGPVAYALDIVRAKPPKDAPGTRQALVVADPSGNLRAARKAVDEIHTALEKKGYRVRILRGHQASRQAVARAMQSTQLFHYAGHAEIGGHEGWSSHLVLAKGDKLDISEILSAKAVPQKVLLAACESARTDSAAHAQTLGLGQAFVVAGSDEVVAAARPLDDSMSARLSVALYGQKDADLTGALQNTLLRIRKECRDCDWSSCRVLVP